MNYINTQQENTALKAQLGLEKALRREADKQLADKTQELQGLYEKFKEVNKELEAEVHKRISGIQALARIPLENPEPVLRINYDGIIVFCNEAIRKIGDQICLEQHLYNFDQFWEQIALLVESAQTRLEIEAHSDQYYFLFTCVPIPEEGYINIYGRDITVRKQTEQELKATTRRLSTLITSIQSGMLVEDQHRRIVLTNQLFCNFFNISLLPEQLIAMDCSQSAEQNKYYFNDPEEFVTRINQILAHRQVVLGEELLMIDGRILERDYIPIVENGEYLGHLWKYQDITERKNLQFTLQRSEEKYRSLIENMNLGLIEVDLNEKILYVNQSFCRQAGYPSDELLGHDTLSLFAGSPVNNLNKDIEQIQERRKEGISDTYEIAIKKKNGEITWMLISGAPVFDQNREIIGSIGIHLDITDRKKLESDLREAICKAEESARAKEIFLANMSHEIRTPMNAIVGMSNLLRKTQLDTEQQTFLKAITTSAENLLVIINDILDISKIEAGKMQFEQVSFRPQEVVRQVMDVLQYKAEAKGLGIRTRIDSRIAPVLRGDPFRLNQILLNLTGNSVKFTENGHIEIGALLLEATPNRQTILFSVTDTGIGIAKERQQHIFDSFTQEDSSITRKYGGTGLGLSICKRLVELMGGTIQVDSEKNQGTVISFRLSLEIGSELELTKIPDQITNQQALAASRILLVEDNEFNRFLARTLLLNYGALVQEAENGLQAIKALQEKDFDLVLMDLQMPEMNGYEATIYIRQVLGKTVPIIALTANAVKGEKEKCLQTGMNDYLSKPFAEKDFIYLCTNWLGKIATPKAEKTAASEASPTRLYDLSLIQSFSHGDMAFVAQMIRIFMQTSRQLLASLQLAYQRKAYKDIDAVAHQFKSSIDNMGITPLKDTIRQIELIGKDKKSTEELEPLLQYMGEILQQVNECLETELLACQHLVHK